MWWDVHTEEEKKRYRSFVNDSKTSLSATWWMLSKLNCALAVLGYWVEKSVIANAENGLDFMIHEKTVDVSQFYLQK